MITIVCLAGAGFLIAKYFELKALLATSAAVALMHGVRFVLADESGLVSGLMLLGSLFALQGGFLVGCFFIDEGPPPPLKLRTGWSVLSTMRPGSRTGPPRREPPFPKRACLVSTSFRSARREDIAVIRQDG